MTPDARRPVEVEPRPVADAAHLSKEASTAQATTLLVAHVEGQDRPRAMVLSPDAVLRLLSQSRGRFVQIATADSIPAATAAVKAIEASQANKAAWPSVRFVCDCPTCPGPASWTDRVHRGAMGPTPTPLMDEV